MSHPVAPPYDCTCDPARCSTPKQYNPASDFAFPEKKRKREVEDDDNESAASGGGKIKKVKTGTTAAKVYSLLLC